MEMPCTYVKNKTGEFQWESVRKGRKSKYLDAYANFTIKNTSHITTSTFIISRKLYDFKDITH